MAEVKTTFQDADVNGKAIKIINFAGQLDETNVDEEAKKVYQVIDEMAEPNLLLDLSDLAYMNSKSIGYVTDWYSRAASKNGKIVIAHPRPNILDILKVVGITQIINIYESIDEAKLAFGGGAETEKAAVTAAPAAVSAEQPAVAPADVQPAPVAPPAVSEPETPEEKEEVKNEKVEEPKEETEPAPEAETPAPAEPAPEAETPAPAEPAPEAETPAPATPPAAPEA